MKKIVKIGYIGLGRRGLDMLVKCFGKMTDVEIKYVCDINDNKIKESLDFFEKNKLPIPKATKNYREIIADTEIDAVINMTGWNCHVDITVESLLAGKYTAVEVGCTYSLEECWKIIEAHEKTGAPLMMLENCCYGRREMAALRMTREGLFGELVHAVGSYSHYLPDSELFLDCTGHYRLSEYINRNCEQYPTHALGPIAKILGINRGNRFLTINSVSSKSRALSDYCNRKFGDENPYKDTVFNQGDIVNSVITCANGETIALTLDTTLPRPYYSRSFSIRGTHGMCDEGRRVFFLEGMEEPVENNENDVMSEHEHPLHDEYLKGESLGNHDGMDWLVSRAFIESVKAECETPIDAYDTVTLMSIACLSEKSILNGGSPVEIPDFTRGKWFRRPPAIKQKYSLDLVVTDENISIWGNFRNID